MSPSPLPTQLGREGPPRLRARFGPLRLAHVPLGELPTRVEPLEALSAGAEVWVKRDDLTSAAYGGNKPRKLELLLGEALARGRERVVTFGAYGSHHALATAIHGRRVGLAVRLELFPQPITPHVARQLRCDQAAGAELSAVPFAAALPLAIGAHTLLARSGEVIPAGGSSPLGTIGFVEAGLELAAQLAAGELPAPDLIVVAGGTCGTAAGLALGLDLAGLAAPPRIVAVRVVPRLMCNARVIARLRARCLARLQEAGLPAAAAQGAGRTQVEVDPLELGRGYGVETPAACVARERFAAAGLALEPTYTAKAAAALLRWAEGPGRGRRVLYWHTLNGADLAPLAARADVAALPPPLRGAVQRVS